MIKIDCGAGQDEQDRQPECNCVFHFKQPPQDMPVQGPALSALLISAFSTLSKFAGVTGPTIL